MKITRNWLAHYTEYSGTADELKEDLTMMGMEVESMEEVKGDFDGIVVGQILETAPHPNADKLSVNKVNDGKGIRQIVCGAKNFKAGDKIPLALPGCTMPSKDPAAKPITISVGKLRGVESQGMMCSSRELGLSEDHSGLMILPTDAPVGQPFGEYMGRTGGDVIYDMEITPNRPDLNSVIGIAREISAVTKNPLNIPQIPDSELDAITDKNEPVSKYVDVRVEDFDTCPRYTARVIRGVKVGPSPDWLRKAVESLGVRSINNIVDVTNFVMLETGQPLHAFDYHLLQCKEGADKPVIVVRHAVEGEEFVTLDGQKHKLNSAMQVIADETKATALAGVMGGLNTEIKEDTVDVLLESAYFKPQNVRATSKKLALHTDASYRYERGADIDICEYAGRRAVQLFVKVAGGKVCDGIIDIYPNKPAEKTITLRYARTNALLGIVIPNEQQKDFLKRLQLEAVAEASPELEQTQVTVKIPSYRVDLKQEADLIEEVGRLYGVNKIPSTIHFGTIGRNPYDATVDVLNKARTILAGMGLSEAQGQTLISKEYAQWVDPDPVALSYPLSADMNVLRPSLLPGLLDCIQRNINHKTNDVALFEIGRVFNKNAEGKYTEGLRLAIAITGHRYPISWNGTDKDAVYDIFDLKGILENFTDQIGLRALAYFKLETDGKFFVDAGKICQGKVEFARFGQLFPLLAKKLDMRDPVFMAEWNMDLVVARQNPARSFKGLNDFPDSRRDVAMLVNNSVPHENVLSAVKRAKVANLEKVELFDIFKGKGVPEGQKSMAYAFTYRNSERTLKDTEVNSDHQKVVDSLVKNLGAVIR